MTVNSAALEKNYMDKKRISVSSKRQITIPLPFFRKLGIDSEVECFLQDGSLIIRPVRELGGTFATEILEDLVAQGFGGPELIAKFKAINGNVRHAVERMIGEADQLARQVQDDGNAKMAEIFGPDE